MFGGSAPFIYTLDKEGGSTISQTTTSSTWSFNNLSSGTYTLTISDGSSCVYVNTYIINNIPSFILSATTTGTTCSGDNGAVLINVSGGTPSFTYILDGGACENGIESTIVGLENEQVIVYRLGGISLEQISNVIGYMPQLKNHSESQPLTSGMVKHHYAPNTPFAYLGADFVFEENKNDGFILLKDNRPEIPITQKYILSETGDLKEAAQKLYAAMHFMDQKHYSKLYIEKFEEVGLGISMNDRLNRATKKFEE